MKRMDSSTLLTCIGAIGVITTAALAARSTPMAIELLEYETERKHKKLTTLETIKVVAPAYIPSAISGLATMACIFGANALNKRQQASLISAYAIVDNAYREYRDKVKELFGEDADKKICESVARDNIQKLDIDKENNKCLFYDMHLGQYFESTMELVVLDDGLECYIVDTPYVE